MKLFITTFAISTALLFSHTGWSAPDSSVSATFPKLQRASADQMRPHIGLQLGYAEPNTSFDGTVNYGIEVGFQPYVPLAAAVELSTFDTGTDGDFRRTQLMAKGTYNFGGPFPIIKHSFVGAAVGSVFDVSAESETNMGIKFLAGVDVPLTRNNVSRSNSFSLGAAANYLTVFNAADSFLINGQLKYWF